MLACKKSKTHRLCSREGVRRTMPWSAAAEGRLEQALWARSWPQTPSCVLAGQLF